MHNQSAARSEVRFNWQAFPGSVLRDLRLAVRDLSKKPGIAFLVVFSLALGIGANAAIFSLTDGILFRPLPVPHPSEIISLDTPASTAQFGDACYPDYVDLAKKSRSFAGLILFRRTPLRLNRVVASSESRPQIAWGLTVSGNYFSVLQIDPLMGRFFRPDEDQVSGKDPVVVISYNLWQRTFGGDPGVLGSNVKLNDYTFTVIGVTPENFSGAELAYKSDFYVPVTMSPQILPGSGAFSGKSLLETRLHRVFSIRGRLQPGVSVEQAGSEATVIMHDLAVAYPDTNKDIGAIVRKELDRRMASNGLVLPALLFSLVIFLLLIACANVANLLMVRATSRLSEIATRLAMGATRSRLIRQMLTENSVLAFTGGAIGLAFGYGAIRTANNLLPLSLAPQGFRMDARVLGYCFLVCVATVFLCGLAPALIATREATQSALKMRNTAGTNRFFGTMVRQLLVGGQIAISIMLLIGGGLLIKTFARAQDYDLGFDANHILVATIDPASRSYSAEQTSEFYKELLRKTEALPGVKSAALTANVNFLSGESWDISIDGYVAPNGEKLADVLTNRIGPKYFETMQTPLLEGRVFAETDTQEMPKVAVVNEKFARQFIVGRGHLSQAIGHVLRLHEDAALIQIVGIVRNSTYGVFAPIGSDPAPIFYLPYLQYPQSRMGLYVRTYSDPAGLTSSVLQQIHGMDPDLVPYMSTLSSIVSGRGLFIPRISAILSGTFGVIALMLAIVGLYGVVSFSVQRRTQEIGIRMALGAQRHNVLTMILRHSFTLVGAGLLIGIVGALLMAPFMASLLIGISSWDPVTFIVLPLILLTCTMTASWVPARRATRVDPVIALRYQ